MSSNYAVPERTIAKALQDGIAFFAIEGNQGAIDIILNGMEADEIKAVKTFVTEWSAVTDKRKVVIGYPRTFQKMPILSVVLRAENEEQGFMGDLVEAIPATNSFWRGTMFGSTYGVGIFTENPDLTLALYRIAKTIILSKRNYLETHNVKNAQLSGSDIQPDPSYLPANVVLRWLDIRCSNQGVVAMSPSEVKIASSFNPTLFTGADDKRNVTVPEQTPGNIVTDIMANLATFTVEEATDP